MQGVRILFAILWTLLPLGAVALFGFADETKEQSKESVKTTEACQAPKWAIAIGHEQMWKLHNGCPTDEDKAKSDN